MVELADRNLDEIQFAGIEGVPAGRVLGDELDFDTVGEWWNPIFQFLQPKARLAGRIEALGCQIEWLTAEALVTQQHRARAVELGQSERPRAHRADREFRAIGFDGFTRNDG